MTDDSKAICIHCGIPGWKHRMCPWQTETSLKYAHPECSEKVRFTDFDGANPKLAGMKTMIDINQSCDKRASTLEKFLENCACEDPYIQNIWMAARCLVIAGVGHCEYETQYESGTTLWIAAGSHHSIPRIPYEPRKPRMVITIHRGLLASVVSDVPINITVLKVDEDTDDTIYREESIEIDPDYVAEKFAEADKFWEEEDK